MPRTHELDIQTLSAEEENDDVKMLSLLLLDLAQTPRPRGVGEFDAFAYEKDEEEKSAVSELRERLQELKIVSRAKVTQDRVYSAAYHPEVTKDLIFFGGMP